jgi:hypothetical protein
MSIAAEAFAEEEAVDAMDIEMLLRHFGDYLGSSGTQPVTIPIEHLVEDMLETYKLASAKASEVHTFAWTQSADLQATLQDFVRTRECLFYTEGCLPAVEASFGVCNRQSQDELTVEIHYTWNPPKVNFETFQNVFDENRSFHLVPRISQPCQGFETSYSVDQSVPIVNWNASEGCLEGYCPPLLASSVGAQRLECFSMPLNMSAQVTTSFPGGIKLERTIRIEMPITIRRRPDACSSDEELENSPAVRKPAVSVLVPSTDTTPQSAEPLRAGKCAEIEDLWTNYKEISALMDRKARTASGKPSPPLGLNPLSMARLWDVTAPTSSDKEVQCWTVGVSQRSSPVQPKTPSKRPLRMVSGILEKSSSKAQKTTPTRTPRRAAEDHVEKPSDMINEIVLTGQVLRAVEHSPKHDSAVKGMINGGNAGPSKRPSSPSLKTQVDPAVEPPSAKAKASNKFALSDKQAYFLAAKALRRNLAKWKHQGLVSPDQPKESSKAFPDPLKEWRKAPEQLNEAEKDALQRAIQAAHQKDLEEMEKKDQEVDESLLVEGDGDDDEDSQEIDF